jgi:hypothetical protein
MGALHYDISDDRSSTVPFISPFITTNVGIGNGEPHFRRLGFAMNMA